MIVMEVVVLMILMMCFSDASVCRQPTYEL